MRPWYDRSFASFPDASAPNLRGPDRPSPENFHVEGFPIKDRSLLSMVLSELPMYMPRNRRMVQRPTKIDWGSTFTSPDPSVIVRSENPTFLIIIDYMSGLGAL